MHRMALRLAGDPTKAEDVTQEAILKAYRSFDTFQPGTNFRAWVHRVLYTIFVNTMRERDPASARLDAVAEPEEEKVGSYEELDRPTHRQRVQAVLDASDDRIKFAVQELPEDLRSVFLLSSVEGLKYREIADVLDCPIGTVMSRLFRSRKMLMDRLTEFALEEGYLKGFPPEVKESGVSS